MRILAFLLLNTARTLPCLLISSSYKGTISKPRRRVWSDPIITGGGFFDVFVLPRGGCVHLPRARTKAAAEIRAETNSYLNLTRLENLACGGGRRCVECLADGRGRGRG